MVTCVLRDRGRLEAIEEYCDGCGDQEAARRGWPRTNGRVALHKGWCEDVTWKRGVAPYECRECGGGTGAVRVPA